MKNKLFGKFLSMTLSLLLVLSLAAVPTAVSAAGVTETQKVVQCTAGYGGYNGWVNLSDYYTYDESEDSYTRTSTWAEKFHPWGYGLLMLGEHRSFVLDFDINFTDTSEYANGSYRQQIMVQSGRELNSLGWENNSGAEQTLMGVEEVVSSDDPIINNLVVCSENTDSLQQTGFWSGWRGYTGGFDYRKTVHANMIISGSAMKIQFSIDGSVFHTVKNTLSSYYDGGYVALGTNCDGVKLSNINIVDIVDDSSDYVYYGSNSGVKAAYNLTDHYSVEEVTYSDVDTGEDVVSNKYTRNGVNADGQGWGSSSQVYFGVHKDFKLSFIGKFTDTAHQYINLTYGEKLVGDSRVETGAATLGIGIEGANNKLTHRSYDSAFDSFVWGDNGDDNKWYNGWGGYVAINAEEEHLFTVTVKDNRLTLDIDQGQYTNSCMVNALYGEGGYVSLGANREGVYFYGVKIEDLTPSTEEKVYLRNADASASIKADPQSVDTYYTVTTDSEGNKSYTRNSTSTGSWTGNVAFLTVGNYKNFRLEYDFEYPYSDDNNPMWINIGNQRENGLTLNYGSLLYALRCNNNNSLITFKTSKDNKIEGWVDYSLEDPYGTTGSRNFRGGRLIANSELTGHVIITVKDNLFTAQIGESIMSYELTDFYKGGFVQLGVNLEGIKLSNIKVENLGEVVSPFTAYYTDSLGTYQTRTYSGSSENGLLTKVYSDRDWSYDGNTLSYKLGNYGNAFNNKMSVAYYNVKQYNEFEMSFEYRSQYGDAAYVGFGAEMGKSWMTNARLSADRKWEPDASNHVVMLRPTGNAHLAPGSNYVAGTDSNENWYFDGGTFANEGELFTTDEAKASYHKATLRVENGKALLIIDGKMQGTCNLRDGYNGGYIYFASNIFGASFRNIKITDLSDAASSYNIDGFTAYYSDKIAADDNENTALTEVNASDYWSYDSATNSITRATTTPNAVETDEYKTEWAQLTYNTRMDENLEVELDVSSGADVWKRAYIGIGAERPDTHFMQEDGGIATHLYPDGETRFNVTGNLWNVKGYSGYEWRDSLPDLPNVRTHHVKITVQNRLISYYVDGELATQWAFPNWYNGGYVYFASNSSAATFANIKINGIDAIPTVTDTALSGKKALFVGDSISVGAADTAMAYGWGGRIGRKYGMDWINYSHGGACVAERPDGDYRTIVEQIQQFGDNDFDYVIIEGGVNDSLRNLDVGEISLSYNIEDFDLNTFAGSLETAFAYVTNKWPNTHIGFIVTFQNRWIGKEDTSKYYNVARTICQKWNVPYLDLNGDTVAGTLNALSETDSYIPDGIHPNAGGYDVLVDNYIEQWMLHLNAWGGLENYARGDFNGDGITNAPDLAAIRQHLLSGDIGVDFSEPDIYGEYAACTPDLNGDTRFDILDLVRMKKIAAGLS